jgi:hypothetical protein
MIETKIDNDGVHACVIYGDTVGTWYKIIDDSTAVSVTYCTEDKPIMFLFWRIKTQNDYVTFSIKFKHRSEVNIRTLITGTVITVLSVI